MAAYSLFFNPMSRATIAHWALLEAGADFDTVMVQWDDKPQALLDANPLGKIPTLIHHSAHGDKVVSEGAAICHYLAEAEESALMPRDHEKADYFRWLFFAAGPLEAATTARSMGWEVPQDREGTVGFGSYDRMVDTLDKWFCENDFVCGERFTMADVYVGSQVAWGLMFKSLPDRPSLKAYWERFNQREAYLATIGALSG